MNSADVMDAVQIVEYEPKYAQAVADMWNASWESWGGGNRIRSAESVAREMENAGNLKVFLAVHGDEVVGFCSFSHYKQDEGALYVPLLNVRPDYHGRKVGKSLIIRAVQTTVEMGWPRLDLFTWAGNTKAVPMYKKCGFFWEKKDDSVHLMNFIPTVLQTEALQPYLKHIDWYADSRLNPEIRPDGRSENGFDYFEYVWAKNNISLRVEFEKTGRGLRLIETDDFSIHTEIEDHDLVFGSRYPVRYVIRNKTGEPLVCTIRGRDDKNIRFSMNETVQVDDTVTVEGEFELEPMPEEQSDWKTHPAVASEWSINGRKAEFRTGIAPKFPAKVKLEVTGHEQYIGTTEEAFITFENNYKQPAKFEFDLPSARFAEFANTRISVRIPAKGRASVKLPYTLRDFGLYSEDVEMKAVPESGAPVTFTRNLHGMFKGNSGRYGGAAGDHWVAVNGPYTVGLNKVNNHFWTSHFKGGPHTWWTSPKIGKPYSQEFSKKKAESVKIYPDGDAMVLEAEYRSDEFPGVAFTAVARLNANGIVERYFEVRSESSARGEHGEDDLYLIDGFIHEPNRLVLPYDGHYYDLEERYSSDYEDWDLDRISENWLFSRGKELPLGICWQPDGKLVKSEWHLGIEHRLGRAADGDAVRTSSVFLTIGTYSDWWDFRSCAVKRREPVRPLLRDHIELCAKDRNPFVDEDAALELRQHRNQPLDGAMSLSSPSGSLGPIHGEYRREEALFSSEYPIAGVRSGTIEPVRMKFNAGHVRFERSAVIIPVSATAVEREVVQGIAGETYRCSNGPLSIEASPSFGAALYSLTFNGEEWLDSSYPEPGPRSWWNPWLGGISASVQGISPLSLQEERRSAEFVSQTDNLGNVWSGIALRTRIEKHREKRGIELTLFMLLLPGAPVLCCVTRVTNRTGLSFARFESTTSAFFRTGSTASGGWMETENGIRYGCGKIGMHIDSEGVIRLGSDERSHILHAVNRFPGSHAWMYTNNLVVNHGTSQSVPMADGEVVWGTPVFFAFASEPCTYRELRGMAEIRFEDNRGL
ncbi:GNAT family N-acetyltransferase [Paenibacillus alkalitolerans]|uniref:GNAT family N-acetyltransferase n=1 Tax=Paenibacillus alkalitolerans TaxID=2799335 RepID=UPI0018F4CBE5|nr:GNAT family N-acetyltransferase [Paenibacillus alkalitolerans]